MSQELLDSLPDAPSVQGMPPLASPGGPISPIASAVQSGGPLVDEGPLLAGLPDAQPLLKQSFDRAVHEDPDKATAVVRYARQFNEPESTVAINLDDFKLGEKKAQYDSQFFDDLEKSSPATAKWLRDPNNMVRAHDSIDTMSLVESTLKALGAGNMARGVAKGAISNEDADIGYGQALESLFTNKFTPVEHSPLYHKRVADLWKAQREGNGSPDSWAGAGLAESVGSMSTLMYEMAKGGAEGAVAMGAGGALAGSVAGPAGAIAAGNVGKTIGAGLGSLHAFFAQEAGTAFEQFKDIPGVEPRQAAEMAMSVGAINAGLGSIGIGKVLGSVPGMDKVLGSISSKAKIFEGLTPGKAVTQAAKNWLMHSVQGGAVASALPLTREVGKAALGADPDFWKVAKEGASSLPMNVATMGVFALPGLASGARGGYQTAKAEQSRGAQQAEAVKSLIGMISDSKRPEVAAEHAGDVAQANGVTHAYFPVEDAERYFQSKGTTLEEAAKQLGPEVEKSVADARETGADVQVPIQTYLDKVASTEHAIGLAEDTKFNRDDTTPRQQQAADKAQEAALSEQMPKEADASKPDPRIDSINREARRERSTFRDELMGSGYDEATADSLALNHSEHLRTMATREGFQSIEEYVKATKGLEVAGDNPDSQTVVVQYKLGGELSQKSQYTRDVLARMREEINAGDHQRGGFVPAVQLDTSNDGKFIPSTSSFPDWFKDRGHTKKEGLNILDKTMAGKILTQKQASILSEMYRDSGYGRKKADGPENYFQSDDSRTKKVIEAIQNQTADKMNAELAKQVLRDSGLSNSEIESINLESKKAPFQVTTVDGVNSVKKPEAMSNSEYIRTIARACEVKTEDTFHGTHEELLSQVEDFVKGWSGNERPSPAFNGEIVKVDRSSIDYATNTVKSAKDQDRRLARFKKAKVVLETAKYVDEVRIEKDGRKRYSLIGTFSDGDIVRVIVDEYGGKKFLSVFTPEKKMDANSGRTSGSNDSIPNIGSDSISKSDLIEKVKNINKNITLFQDSTGMATEQTRTVSPESIGKPVIHDSSLPEGIAAKYDPLTDTLHVSPDAVLSEAQAQKIKESIAETKNNFTSVDVTGQDSSTGETLSVKAGEAARAIGRRINALNKLLDCVRGAA